MSETGTHLSTKNLDPISLWDILKILFFELKYL